MAHYSIFIPNGQGADTVSHFSKCGLSMLNRHGGWEWQDVSADNPAGIKGTIGTVRRNSEFDPILGVDSGQQKWIEGPPVSGVCEKGEFWFIYEPARPPRPVDLAHKNQFDGHWQTLNDKQDYLIPEAIKLPQAIGRDPDTGRVARTYSGDYEGFCRRAEQYVALFFSAQLQIEVARSTLIQSIDKSKVDELEAKVEEVEKEVKVDFTLEDTWKHAAEALSLNYRIADPIMGHGFLDLVEDRHLVAIVRHTVGYPDILEVKRQKKTGDHVSIPVG